ncbi:hypothetical protein Dsin_031184 [Dipteronia sinensis]|uniref:Uncharacterized protein n=1 Tax=Dipteronia sinensis TaxID=43782 RepID=A0AAD9ZLF6_9ROSI|nr:hypothetical protein Dsin_031184 [Dipteronia sinensis]
MGDNSDLLKAVHIVYTQLDPEAAEISNFGNELIYLKDEKKSSDGRADMAARSKMQQAKKDKVVETDFMDLLQVAVEAGEDNENPFFDWVRPAYFDDDEENPNPQIASHARDMRINVEQVIREEVGVDRGVKFSSSSNDQHTSDGNGGGKDDGDDGDGGGG